MKLQDKIKMMQDKQMVDDLLRKMHAETSEMLATLFQLHADAEHISLVEQIMGDIHCAIHNAQDRLMYRRSVT